jgi:hypothetical protein
MAVFGKVSGCLAPRDAIDNEFFRWLPKPKRHTKRRLGIAAAGSLALSPMVNVLADPPRESSHLAVRSRIRDGRGHVTIVDQSLARTIPSVPIYNIRAFANFINAPTCLSEETPILASYWE